MRNALISHHSLHEMMLIVTFLQVIDIKHHLNAICDEALGAS